MAKPPPSDPVVPNPTEEESTEGLDTARSPIGLKPQYGIFKQDDFIKVHTILSCLKLNKGDGQFYEHDTSIQKVFEDMNDGSNSTLIGNALTELRTDLKYSLNNAQNHYYVQDYDATSAASYTFTATAGHTFVIYYIGTVNGTRNTGYNFYFKKSGGTERKHYFCGALINTGRWYSVLGAAQHANTTGGLGMDFKTPFVLQAGDYIKVEDSQFQAGDTRAVAILYYDITD